MVHKQDILISLKYTFTFICSAQDCVMPELEDINKLYTSTHSCATHLSLLQNHKMLSVFQQEMLPHLTIAILSTR